MPLNIYTPEQLKTNKYFYLNIIAQNAKYNLELHSEIDNDDTEVSEYIYYIEKALKDYKEEKINFEIVE